MKKIFYIFAISLFLFSCNEAKKEPTIKVSNIEKSKITTNYKSLEVDIEGMTCEIGCARTIQSKLFKVDGVTYSNVDFEAKKGQFTYDATKITKEDIIKKINGIGGGTLYKVTKTSELKEVLNNKETF